jgi:hypothetical protein
LYLVRTGFQIVDEAEVDQISLQGSSAVLHFSQVYIYSSEGRPAVDAGTGWTQRDASWRKEDESQPERREPSGCPRGKRAGSLPWVVFDTGGLDPPIDNNVDPTPQGRRIQRTRAFRTSREL